jgi:3-methyladenine DNA glycosylase AlkD
MMKKSSVKKSTAKPEKKKIAVKKSSNTKQLSAAEFTERLYTYRSAAELKKYQRFFKFSDDTPLENDVFIGVRMGHVFDLAKEFVEMDPSEIEKLMESEVHEVRAGGMSIMGKQARLKKTTPERLKELYQLYLRRHDRINSWDLVDLAAHYVVGPYLADKSRSPLYKLARSKDPWERRTAILSTAHFIMRLKETQDTFKLAEILLKEKEDLVQKAVGWMLRTTTGVDKAGLLLFLNKHAAMMPRPMLRAAIENLDKRQKEHYMGLKAKADK